MMKLNDFINKLELALKEPSKYQSGGWGKWDGKYWNWDCICLIKGILRKKKNDKTKPRGGGAVYGSNGVPDKGTEEMIKLCKNVSSDFSKLTPGEMVWMPGHVGVCFKDGVIIEATIAFGGGCVKSKINSKGQRLNYNTGKYAGPTWQKHGKLPWVDYSGVNSKPEPIPEPVEEWGKGIYNILISKTIRTSMKLDSSNRVTVGKCTAATKKVLTSTKASNIAMIKVGTNVSISYTAKDSEGRIWGAYGNCYIVLCNADGTPQAKKIK